MLILSFKACFILVSLALFSLICYGKLFVFFKKDAIFISDYTSSIGFSFLLYVVLCVLGAFLFNLLFIKSVFILLAFSPFLIGYFAKYETEKYFTAFQLLVLVLSASFVFAL